MNKKISLLLILMLLLTNFAWADSEAIRIEVNNEEITFDVTPRIIENRTLIAIRPIFESLGLEVFWNNETRTVTGKDKDTLIKLEIDSASARVDDKVVELELPAMIINERAMLPVRFFEKALGAEVTWDKDTRLVSINIGSSEKEYLKSLTYSNLLDEESQNEVRRAMEASGIPNENIDFFFEEVNYYNKTIEGRSLVEKGFKTIDSLEPEYDIVSMIDLWDAKNPLFIGYNCRIISYDLMKDSIHIGKPDTSNSNWMVFDENALEYNPKDVFTEKEHEDFQTLFSSVPAEDTKDIYVHLENVKKDWANKEIEFLNEDKRSIVSVFFHDHEDYLFIGHMGVLIPTENNKLLFIEKLSFQEPYQAIKFNNRTELNDYLMNKYDISWNQPTARPFIMENNELLKGYRANPKNLESNLNE